jgi:isochorismate synthase/2-succinyl-5-enolpyruvyl-6-hydroxy-3-cyclohexene-1-carboxylate synthase/2-succinyl-6-hydroxy-2,4-cyclohexadiene-1-carboxylate synthase/O-succinylbenzoate synthase
VQFAYYVNRQHDLVAGIKRDDSCRNVAHGLGTYQWLREDVSEQKLKIHDPPLGDGMGASVEDAHGYLQHLSINNEKIVRTYTDEEIKTYSVQVDGDDFSYLVNLQEAGDCANVSIPRFLLNVV